MLYSQRFWGFRRLPVFLSYTVVFTSISKFM